MRGLTRVRTVSLTGRRPKRMASPVEGIQMSIFRRLIYEFEPLRSYGMF